MMNTTYSHSLLVVLLILMVVPASFAGDGLIFSDGFETGDTSMWSENLGLLILVDVAVMSDRVCVLDGEGDIRCALAPGATEVPQFIAGDFVDLAGTSLGICARAVNGTVQCWGETRFTLGKICISVAVKGDIP